MAVHRLIDAIVLSSASKRHVVLDQGQAQGRADD
jgi:hypothetical protein